MKAVGRVCLALVASAAAWENVIADDSAPLYLPDWEVGVGAGGYFFEAHEQYDPGGYYQAHVSYNFDPLFSVDGYFGGMPQLNDNPPEGIQPPPADKHNWGLIWGLDAALHLNDDEARVWDPFLTAGVGIQNFDREIEGVHTNVIYMAGAGLTYRMDQNWGLRGDYRAGIVNQDDDFNQMGVVSVVYSFEKEGVGAPAATRQDTSPIDNRPLGLKTIYFDFDKSVIRPDAQPILRENANWMLQHPNEIVIIEGHCDERGTDEYNVALGHRRAEAAYKYLRTLGVPASQMKTISYGENNPADPGHNETAWAKNRRVECRGE